MTNQLAGSAWKAFFAGLSVSSKNSADRNSSPLLETPWRRVARARVHVALASALTLLGGFCAPAQAQTLEPSWNQLSPGTSPPPGIESAFTYDPIHSQAVLFGGVVEGSYSSDTWLWNGSTWTHAASSGPSARSSSAMAYDAISGKVVLFGGVDSNGNAQQDTWFWNGSSWSQVPPSSNPANNPPARFSANMVYDAALGEIVMFGGTSANNVTDLNDTWVWNGSTATWTQVNQTGPSARDSFGMAYDSVNKEVVLFGGYTNTSYSSETWTFDGTNFWVRQSPANSPPGRDALVMAYDPELDETVMFGGINNQPQNDTWEWNGTTWTNVANNVPSARWNSVLAYDAEQDQLLLFSGWNSPLPDDTWSWGTQQNFGNVNVCPSGQSTPAPCSNTMALTYSVNGATYFGTPQVVVQGTASADFTLASGSTCIPGAPPVGTCTVNVAFTPQEPGLRTGAVNLVDPGGNLLTTTPIYGIGQAPSIAFGPGTQTTVPTSGLHYNVGLALDGAGDLYVADYSGSGAGVYKVTPGGVQTPVPATGLIAPVGVAVDGAGDVFIVDLNLSYAVEVTPAGVQTTVGSGLSGPIGIAVDGTGDVFIGDKNNNRVVEVTPSGVQTTVPVTGLNQPWGVAVDGAGDVFIADGKNSRVVEFASSGVQSTVPATGLSQPYDLAVDGAGDVFIADPANSRVVEVPAGGGPQTTVGSGLNYPSGVTVDAAGDVFIADQGSGNVYEVNRSQPPSLSFNTTYVGFTSDDSPQSFTIQNIGTRTLSTVGPGLVVNGPNFIQVPGPGTPPDCPATFALTIGADCNVSISFTPQIQGLLGSTAVFTDNALNSTSTSQALSLNGGAFNPVQTLNVSGTGNGSVSASPTGINCSIVGGVASGNCSSDYVGGEGVSLEEIPSAGFTFAGWGGACASSGSSQFCNLNVNATTNVTASFSAIAYTAPTTAVNATSAVQTATVTFGAAGTLGAISVVTQGATGKDFNFSSGGTCAVGTAYSAGQGCTVNYTFTPLAPGGRKGAVLLTDGSGNVLGTSYLSGIGVGPQGLFDTTPQTVSISGLNMVRGLSLDGYGNLYAFETTSGSIDEFPAGTSTTVQLASITVEDNSGATAVDGAGNLYVIQKINGSNDTLWKLAGGKGPAVQVASVPVADNNLEIDGAGNLYFSGYEMGTIYEISAGTNQVTTLFPGAAGQRFIGMAIDAAGNLFAADYNNSVLYELPAGTNSLVTLASGGYLSNPHGVAVDPAGNIYVTNASGSAVIRYEAGTYAATLLPEQGQRGIALDSAGNLYTITSDSTIAGYTRTQASPMTFANPTAVGTTSDSQQGDLFENDGNAGLVITGYSATAPFALGGTQDTCDGTGTLPSGASCVVGAIFTPTASATVGGTAIITDNNLNVPGTAQTVSLSGTGVGTNYTLTVTDIGSGSGTVTDNSQITCTETNGSITVSSCSGSYTSGTGVTLYATASAGSAFLGWGGACASSGTSPTCIVTTSASENVTASFSPQSFGAVNVCPSGETTPAPCSSTQSVTFNLAATATIGAIQVVTQGETGLDFTLGTGGTCTGTITAGSSCTVNVNFAPLAPGSRLGAVELFDNSANLLTAVPVYGIGQAPAIAFGPGAQATLSTGLFSLPNPKGVLVDAGGNVFISDASTQQVLKVAPNGSVSSMGFGFQFPQGMAEDGAGDLYVADNNLNEVVEIPAGCASINCQVYLGSNFRSQLGVAVDGAGDVFFGDFLDGEAVEIPAGCTATACQEVVYHPGGASDPVDLRADGAGDLFIADYGRQKVVEVPAGCASSSCQITIGSGWSQPDDVAVDAAGDVFVADAGLEEVVEIPVGCASSACQVVLVSGTDTIAVAADATGDLVVDDLGHSRIFELTRSQPPSLSFALANVGVTSADSPEPVTVQNVGNQPLTGSVGATASRNFVENPNPASTCGAFTLAPGAICSESFGFTPQSTGILTDGAVFSDNTLNLASSVVLQTVSLSGIGSVNGQTGTAVPNVVGMAEAAAATTLTDGGLTLGTVSSESSSSEPAGSVIGESPAAGTPVNLGSAVALLISTGVAPPTAPNPLTLENNYFVTGDFATAGVNLRETGSGSVATGTINIPDSTSGGTQGVPDGADLVDGFLYWETLENTAVPSGNTGTFLGYPITGQQIGSDLPYTDSGANLSGTLRVYRADVNAYFQLPASFNGARLGSGPFTITLPDSGPEGHLPLNEGASLVIIYRALSTSVPLKSVVIYDGSTIPTTPTTQNVQGFYDAVGAAAPGEVATLNSAGGNWNSSPNSVTLPADASQYTATLNAGAAYAAVVFSTPVANSDNDGILNAWKKGPQAPDFFSGQPGYYDVKSQSWVPLPGAKSGEKDLFVQLDYMCGAVLSNGQCDPNQENLFPSPDSNGNDPLAIVQQSFASMGIVLHLEVGNAVPESTCADGAGQLCQFPGEPGVIGWKNSLEFSKLWPRNFTSCASGGDCTARFPFGQKDSYHYVLFGHSLAIPAWNTRFGSLTAITSNSSTGQTTITTTNRGAQGTINYCPTRFTISGVLSNSSLNGVYNTVSCPDAYTIILSTPGVSNWSYSYAANTPPEPGIGLTSGTVTSISGYSDLGGADSAVTLALWETAQNQDMSKRAQVIAGTLFHEIGHTLGLSHGGLYYNGGPGSYIPTFDVNCKPNYQSSMNYLFQLDGVGPNAAVAYSNQTLETLSEASLSQVNSLLDINSIPATFSTSSWYTDVAPSQTASAATWHCDGSPLTGDTGYRVVGSIAPPNPGWSQTADPNITFDGVPYTNLLGYDDVTNVDLRQVGATGGELASLASVLSFGNSSAPVNIEAGGSVSVGAGGTATVGTGGTVTLINGGGVTVPGGAVINGGGTILFSTGANAMLSASATITPGSSGLVTLPNGGSVALNTGGTITMGGGGTITMGGGGTITMGGGASITLPGVGGTVTISSAGGIYTVPAGGAVTLNSGSSAMLTSGTSVTIGGSGTIAMGGGGTITMGGGANITMGVGGTITMGGGGTITMGGGANLTMAGGGTITMGGGGTITMGGGANLTMAGGGTITMGGGSNVSVGAGGNVTLANGGSVTLSSGDSVALNGGAGNITMGGGANITFGGGGGTITMGGGAPVMLGTGGGQINGVAEPAGYSTTVSAGGIISLNAGGSVSLPSGGGNITMGGGASITMGGGGTITMGGGANLTMGGGGVVALGGAGGNVTLGGGGAFSLGGGGSITMGGGGTTDTEMDYTTANSIVRPPPSATYSVAQGNGVQVNWTAPAFGVVQTYTISRSVITPPSTTPSTPVVIGSVSGVSGFPPATTFTDTNPPAGTLIYTIATTLVPDTTSSTPRSSAPSPPAVLTLGQTIVLGSLASSVSISTTSLTVTATAESNNSPNGLQVSFSAAGPCSIVSGSQSVAPIASGGASSATVTLNSTGSCTIIASQAGNSTTAAATGANAYSAATPVSGTFVILPQGSTTQPQTITFAPLPSVQYGSGFSVSASSSASLPVSFSASGPCSVGATAGTASGATTGAGLCRITASAPAGPAPNNSTYSAASLTRSFTILTAPLTVTANPITVGYGQSIPQLSPAFGSLVNGDSLTTAVSGIPALSTTATSSSSVGAYPITVSTGSLAAANYSFVFVPGTLTIQQASQAALTLGAGSPLIYSQSEALSVTGGSSGGAVTYRVTAGSCMITGALLNQLTANSGAGSCTVSATMAGNGNYNPVNSNSVTVILQPASQAITFTTPPPASAAYNTSFTVAATGGASGNAVIFTSSGSCSNNGATYTMTSSTGTCSVIANQAGNSNFAAAPTVTKTVTTSGPAIAVSPSSINFGAVTLDSITAGSITVSNTGNAAATISTPLISLLKAGNLDEFVVVNLCPSSLAAGKSCTIEVFFAAGAYYSSPQTATLGVMDNAPGSPQPVALSATVLEPQTITFTTSPPASAVYNSHFTVAATASSGLAVTYTSSGMCTNSGATYTMTSGTGTCSVIANQAGNSTWAPATQVAKSVSATLAPQTITFTTSPPASAVYKSSFAVAATASSGLAVTYTSSGACSNSGATYTMTSGTGTCSVIANQAGNSNYAAATQVTKTVSATPAAQTIAFTTSPPATAAYKTGFTVAATASSGLAVTYTSSGACSNSGATYTMTSGTGTCSVIANQAGNSSYSAAPQVTLTVSATYPLASLTPASLSFGTVSSGKSSTAQNATLSNTGTTPLIISSIGFTGTNQSNFSQTNTCPSSSSSLAAGKSCTISVTFNSSGKAASASLTVTDNTQAGTQAVTLSGN
jgi:sugar lactone lactonase YvrE